MFVCFAMCCVCVGLCSRCCCVCVSKVSRQCLLALLHIVVIFVYCKVCSYGLGFQCCSERLFKQVVALALGSVVRCCRVCLSTVVC